MNFDGSSQGNPSPSGFGGLISDSSGGCLIAFSGPLGHENAIFAELKAALFGLKLIHDKCLNHQTLCVEGDSVIVIGWLKNGKNGSWRLSHLLRDVVFLVSSLNISFKWIPREANSIADGLAKRGVLKQTIFMGLLEDEISN